MKPFQKSTRRLWREKIKSRGFCAQFDLSEVAAAADIIATSIANASNAKRASTSVRKIYDIIETSTKNHSQIGLIACKMGCNYCCHQYVSASPLEIFYFAHMIENSTQFDEHKTSIFKTADLLETVPQSEIQDHTIRCGLLTDKCSAYAGRPISCRGYNSENVNLCIQWQSDRTVGIPINRQHLNFSNKAKVAMWAALQYRNLPKTAYELNEGLRVVLSTPDAESKWLSGDNIFEGVKSDEYDSAETTAMLNNVISLLRSSQV